MENISNSATVQADRTERVHVTSLIFRIVIVFLVTFIIVLFLLIIGILRNQPYIPADVRAVILDSLVCQNCIEENNDEDIELYLNTKAYVKNKGWSLYQYPEYGLRVEVPPYTYFDPEYTESPSYMYVWDIYSFDTTNQEYIKESIPEVFTNFERGIRISFFPIEIPEDVACGEGCLGEPIIKMDFYDNEEDLDIESVEENFQQYVKDIQNEYGDGEKYEVEFKTMFEKDAFTYEYEAGISSYEGYVLLLRDSIAVIQTAVFSEGEVLDIVNMVIDSIYFQ